MIIHYSHNQYSNKQGTMNTYDNLMLRACKSDMSYGKFINRIKKVIAREYGLEVNNVADKLIIHRLHKLVEDYAPFKDLRHFLQSYDIREGDIKLFAMLGENKEYPDISHFNVSIHTLIYQIRFCVVKNNPKWEGYRPSLKFKKLFDK